MAINFCYDHLGSNPHLGHPNLVPLDLSPDLADTTWPFCVPLRLLMYLQRADLPFRAWQIEQAPLGSWYPVALSWHDHSIDYFALLSDAVLTALRERRIRILFYYHEGDNPAVIQTLLDRSVIQHVLPKDCYLFVSANTDAKRLDRFCYLSDHDHFFQYINRGQRAAEPPRVPRPYQFTALSRTHKWWRASIMSDLWRSGLLDRSQWSYNTDCVIQDDPADNPLCIYEDPDWVQAMQDFLDRGPWTCDSLDADLHNDHRSVNVELYHASYCHLVLETHFDADGSQGSFITEKTYKCLKFGQPFVMAAPPGSLACLRQQGYRVFDSVMDNSYDTIADNTQRWFAVKRLIQDLAQRDLYGFYLACLPDLLHNQNVFMGSRKPDLVDLAQYLDAV